MFGAVLGTEGARLGTFRLAPGRREWSGTRLALGRREWSGWLGRGRGGLTKVILDKLTGGPQVLAGTRGDSFSTSGSVL